MEKKGLLIVISGFSGAGKGTIVKQLVERYGYGLSVSCTTRAPRAGEVDGKDYHFKTKEEFERLIDYNGFIEYAQYVDNYYGTPRAYVEQEMAAGHNVILEIEVQGAMNIKNQYPDAVLLFVSAPSAKELKERLLGRGSEDMQTVNKRMQRAIVESDSMHVYDYIVINDDLEKCVEHVHGIIDAEASKSRHNEDFMNTMKQELIAIGKEQ
jgi:guanylate kinase